MEIFDFLAYLGIFSTQNSYNGYLKDYVEKNEDVHNELFKSILEINPDVRIYKNYGLKIQHQLISNKMIGYKDIRKLPENGARIPYLLYWANGETQRCILCNTDSYIEARGMYYCMTEPGNEFETCKNNLLAVYLEESNYEAILKAFTRLQDPETINGAIQKQFDELNISDVDVMKDECLELANKVTQDVDDMIAYVDKKERKYIIYHNVSRYFLLKKALYVRYMSNKKIVQQRHAGNSSEARKFAKCYIDEIVAKPYYQMWND